MTDLYDIGNAKNKEVYLANGTNSLKVVPSASMSADLSLILPPSQGGAGDVLSTNGAGVLSWLTPFQINQGQNGYSAQSQSTTTNLDEKTITFPSTYSSVPVVVATSEGSSNDFYDRYLNSLITNITTTNFTYGSYMKYNAKGIVSTTAGSYYDLITSGGNKHPLIVYLNAGVLYAKVNLEIDGTGYWGLVAVIATAANTKPSLVVLTNLTNGVAYQSNTNTLQWAYNYSSNSWVTNTIDATAGSGSNPKVKLIANGIPVIMALNGNNLYTYLSSNLTGTGIWTSNLALSNVISFDFTYLSTNYPAIIYFDNSTAQLIITVNSLDDMTGSWSTSTVITTGTNITSIAMCILANGNPACTFYDASTGSLRFAVSTNANGSGSWNIYIIGTANGLSPVTILNDGTPAISYINGNVLYMTKNGAIDGSGLWSTSTINSGPINTVGSLITNDNQLPSVAYDDGISLYYERSCLPDRFPSTTSYTINWAASL